jgi:aryl-alcohol dehydrogenase-like predicted oxidoreductase
MIKGHATIDATADYAARHAPVSFAPLGHTGLMASQAGFGGYRISSGVSHHEKALRTAICSGINLIDTSANYADGGSETLVGQVLEDLTAGGEVKRQQVIVISKVGYLQGENFALSQQRKSEGRAFEDLVEYGQGLEHCIHPEFVEDQLTRSLARLKLETLDGYLLHNPEYYLGWASKNGLSLKSAREEYYRRIRAAFEHLEKEVEKGRIRHYGISSNTFVSAAADPELTCLETVWEIAEAVSADHHFGFVQMPFNLLEPAAVLENNQPGGKSALSFAAQKGLGVLTNRPLNAFAAGRLLRLADLPICLEEAFEAVGSIYIEEAAQVLNRIRYAINDADSDWKKQGTLSQKAIRALRSTAGVSVVLVGMRRKAYVEDVLSELKRSLEQKERQGSWERLRQEIAEIFPSLR